MKSFLTRYSSEVKGVLSGFDRVRFRGTLRWLANARGMQAWLVRTGVLLKDFRDYAMGLTERVRQNTQQVAESANRPVEYLTSSSIRKEEYARQIAERDQITAGLVCVLTAVEPCMTFSVGPNRQAKRLELRYHQAKCLHEYFYLIDPEWGWLNVRLQTWLPFTIKVVVNGRERLAQQLLRKGMDFERRDNCFTDLADPAAAQRLIDSQRRTRWSRLLDRLTARVHPAHRTLFGKEPLRYYWSADETEWATDIMFDSPEALARVYPRFLQQAITGFSGSEVLRFLGKCPHVQHYWQAELVSHLGKRVEGLRVKHSLDGNSIKMYDKQGSVLRVETTINQTRAMKVYRASEDNPEGPKSWQKMRKGVADLHRRATISQSANERYLQALAAVDTEATLAETTASLCRRTTWKGRPVRALNPLAEEDAALLQAVQRGEFAVQGFRNRDLRRLLFAEPQSETEKRSQTAKTTRLIRLLRAHGLVHKVPKTHRYTISAQGRTTITALLNARRARTSALSQLAA
jgi:hypothetical protein